MSGDRGDDSVRSGDNGGQLYGGYGDDDLIGSANDDYLHGGPGSDLFQGGDGSDVVTYFDRTAPVFVSIDGVCNDGQSGEADCVELDVENASGGSGDDLLEGSAGANGLVGNFGDDEVNGGDGDDTLSGGPGADALDGGRHNDTLLARDDESDDPLACGNGTGDSARLDPLPLDPNPTDCETIDRA